MMIGIMNRNEMKYMKHTRVVFSVSWMSFQSMIYCKFVRREVDSTIRKSQLTINDELNDIQPKQWEQSCKLQRATSNELLNPSVCLSIRYRLSAIRSHVCHPVVCVCTIPFFPSSLLPFISPLSPTSSWHLSPRTQKPREKAQNGPRKKGRIKTSQTQPP